MWSRASHFSHHRPEPPKISAKPPREVPIPYHLCMEQQKVPSSYQPTASVVYAKGNLSKEHSRSLSLYQTNSTGYIVIGEYLPAWEAETVAADKKKLKLAA
ncbi:hypothetical protein Bbelb_083900 [Branchiostoma belcheri]|nr:hypothetical protein Bbelb_083900 [Branchiostoma belcheri]